MNSQSVKKAGEKYLPVVHSSLCYGNIKSVYDLCSINLSSFSILFLNVFSSFSSSSSYCYTCFSCHIFPIIPPLLSYFSFMCHLATKPVYLSVSSQRSSTLVFPIFIVCFRKKMMDMFYQKKDSRFWSRLTWISWSSRVPTMHICYMP
jgi:hypothetical protein